MAFESLTEKPQEATIEMTLLGLFLAQNLDTVDMGVLGRFLIFLGEVLVTVAVLQAAQETKESQAKTADKEEAAATTIDNIKASISELQQQNQYLQEQIWAMQKK